MYLVVEENIKVILVKYDKIHFSSFLFFLINFYFGSVLKCKINKYDITYYKATFQTTFPWLFFLSWQWQQDLLLLLSISTDLISRFMALSINIPHCKATFQTTPP